ncbi:pyrimidine-nucleoside phosphorylase [Terribacillus sp. FSL K6-0262]|uniref:pyrimidine-nucleoside phosphorylase n=1 Tax=Terribacillus sp. FSL K6-0262 TaxID=2921447 RepID=UPI0030EDA906
MLMKDIIEKKRDKQELTEEEIRFFIDGYTNKKIPDYQASALLMAMFLNDLTPDEIAALTAAMIDSGETIDLSSIEGLKIDKHSTGGVGDKVSLIIAPIVASLGVPVAKMSGRGLGHTGGTLDKLESIPGFDINLSKEEFVDTVNKNKIALIGQTGNLVPADKMLYALRDVTGTVNSIGLIASSIMSKKLATGADGIVLDVKTGYGAFMERYEDAEKLAETMVDIGKKLGKNVTALITDMNQPLGAEVGNANEIKEVVQILKGESENELLELSKQVAVEMLLASETYKDKDAALRAVEEVLANGQAIEKLKQFVTTQKGDASFIDDYSKLPQPEHFYELKAEQDGYVNALYAQKVGKSAMLLGAGRASKEDDIDHSAGITLKKKVGTQVQSGETLAVLFSRSEIGQEAIDELKGAYVISDVKSEVPTLIKGKLSSK